VSLYQFTKSITPVTTHSLINGFLGKCFGMPGMPAKLVDKETKMGKLVEIKYQTFSRWCGSEGLEKIITSFKSKDVRHLPIEIEGYYLGLVYEGPDKTFALIHGLQDLPDPEMAKYCRPMTLTDLLHHAVYRIAHKYPGIITRYPVTGVGSSFPARAWLKTTITSEKRNELDPNTWQPIEGGYAREYPIHGKFFYDTLSPHPTRLARLSADHDGDTASWTAAMSDEVINDEFPTLITKRRFYMDTSGNFIHDLDRAVLNQVLRFMTHN
jgi:hypothetical protein